MIDREKLGTMLEGEKDSGYIVSFYAEVRDGKVSVREVHIRHNVPYKPKPIKVKGHNLEYDSIDKHWTCRECGNRSDEGELDIDALEECRPGPNWVVATRA